MLTSSCIAAMLPPHCPCPPTSCPPAALLDRILELLLGFVRRTHQSLAAVGVAALVRLIVAAGPHLDEPTWMMVRGQHSCWRLVELLDVCTIGLAKHGNAGGQESLSIHVQITQPLVETLLPFASLLQMLGALSAAAGDTMPNVSDLIQHRMARRTSDVEALAPALHHQQHAAPPAAAADGSVSLRQQYSGSFGGTPGGSPRVDRRSTLFSLGEGAGARRLAEVHVRAAIQLLLVQACSEVYTQHSRILPPAATVALLDVLRGIASHAASVDADAGQRHSLLLAQAADKVGWSGGGRACVAGAASRAGRAGTRSLAGTADHLPPLGPPHCRALCRLGAIADDYSPLALPSNPRQVPPERALGDPPLLRLEAEASQAYLSVLLHVQAAAPEGVRAACACEARLTQLCLRNLERFEQQEELAAAEEGGSGAALWMVGVGAMSMP